MTFNVEFPAWAPKSLQSLPVRPDASKAFMDNELLNQPLPIYSTDLSAESQAILAQDTMPEEATEPSPLATYGVLPVSFFGISALAANEMFLVNEEALLIGTWSCFLLTCYVQFSDAFNQAMASKAAALKETHIQGVDAQLAAIDNLTAALNARVAAVEEAKNMQSAFNTMLVRVKAMAIHRQKRLLHQIVNDRLREVYQIEIDGSKKSIEQVAKMVNEIVVVLISANPALRKEILSESIAALSAGPGAKVNNDRLLEVYKNAFAFVRYEMEKLRVGGYVPDKASKDALAADVMAQLRRHWGDLASGSDLDEKVRARQSFKLPSYTRDSA